MPASAPPLVDTQRWQRAGRPDLDRWLAAPPKVKQPEPGATCRIDHCDLWPQASLPFCHSHTNTWKTNGRPDIAPFARRFAETPLPSDEIIALDRLPARLKLEMQYVLQCRHDERSGKLSPHIVMRVVRFLAQTSVTSLLDDDEDGWRQQGRSAFTDSLSRSLLGYAHRRIVDLAETGGWTSEYPRDVWRLHRLGFDGRRTIRFDAIAQPWLRELVKRWTRWRLSCGLGLEAAVRPVRVLTRFSRFLAAIQVELISGVDRAVLERYLADLHTDLAGTQRHNDHIGLLGAFLAAIRQHRWNDDLPAEAIVFAEDYPQRAERLPRALAEQIMTQLEDPDTPWPPGTIPPTG